MENKTRNHFIVWLTVYVLLCTSAWAQKPVLPDFHADPSAHEWDGKYWIYPSVDEPGSTDWLQMKQWDVFSSTDLVHWENHGPIFDLDDITWADQAAFAPDAMKWKGKYYFFFPADFQIGVAISDSPTGPFKDALGKPLIERGEADITSFDPTIFIDDDSTAYLYYGGWGTVGVTKLKDDLITRDGEIHKLNLNGYSEGIWVHKFNGTYYFSYPSVIKTPNDKRKQILVYCTAKSPLGPFEYRGAFFDNNSRNSHHSIVEFDDQWYLFYHIEGPSPYERRVCIEYLEHDENGFIKFIQMTKEGIGNTTTK